MKYVQAEVHAGAWKLKKNDIWNIPDDIHEVRFDMDASGLCVYSVKALAKTLDGKIFGIRTMNYPKESGYNLEGRISIGGKKYRAFTSSQLFEREDGSLCDVAVFVVSGLKLEEST